MEAMSTDEIELSQGTRTTLDQLHLTPLWEISQEELAQRREKLETAIWHWEDVRTAVESLAEEVPSDVRARVTVPVNPTYDGALSHTISVGIETAPPGDMTPAHRHSGHFLRFAIDGHPEMTTAVGGEEFPMRNRDLVTIPPWTMHGHVNETEEEVSWLVVDDTPLRIGALNIGNLFERNDEDRQAISRSQGYHRSLYGNYRLSDENAELPGALDGSRYPTPPFRFSWDDMADAVEYAEDNERAWSQHDGVVVQYANPARGNPPLYPTYGVRVHRLLDGVATEPHRHNATEVFYVIEGTGETTVEDRTLEWSERDIFVVPTYKTHSHNPDNEATLLTLTDRPLLEALNSYHELAPE